MGKIGSFGTVVFQVADGKALTFQDWSETEQGRYAVQSVVGGGQVVQYLGPALSERRLKIDIKRGLVADPEAVIKTLLAMVSAGAAYPLILGREIHGHFYLKRLQVQRRITDQAGSLVTASVDLELLASSINGRSTLKPVRRSFRGGLDWNSIDFED